MAAHRYWRLAVASTAGGGAAGVGSFELRVTPGGSNEAVTGSGTASASSNDLYSPANAFDSNVGTYWLSQFTGPHWVAWDFGSGNDKDITEAKIVNHNSANTDRSVANGRIEYSDDNTTWVVWSYFSGRSSANSASTTHTFLATPTATAALTLPSPTLAAHGGHYAALTCPAMTSVGYSGGQGAATFPAITGVGYSGIACDMTAPAMTALGIGHDSTGENGLAHTLDSLTMSGYGGANSQLDLPGFSLEITGTATNWGRGASTLPALTLDATASVSSVGNAALTFGYVNGGSYVFEAFGGANAELTAPALTQEASGTRGVVGHAALISGAATIAAFGGVNASLSGPRATLSASGLSGATGSATLAMPAATLAAFSGASAALVVPGATLSAAGLSGSTGGAAVVMPTATLVGYSGAVCSVTIGGITVAASGTAGSVGHAALTLPLFELTADGTAQNYGSADVELPALQPGATARAWLIAPGFKLTAIGTAVVAATYEAYAINLNHANPEANDEVTRYTNFPFTHIVRYLNSYYGANSTGLYLLEGTTDAGVAIPWAFKTGQTDFKDPHQKTVAAAYFGGRLGPDTTITLYAGEGAGAAYSHSTPRGQLAQNHRQKFGKGVKARYYAIGAAGSGALELDDIEFDINTLTRRI